MEKEENSSWKERKKIGLGIFGDLHANGDTVIPD
jgi:hypothetical protein